MFKSRSNSDDESQHFAHCCAYCRTAEVLTVAIFEFEHILPRSAAGATVFEKLCFCCPTCNRFKADRTTAIDPDTQNEVALFHPHREMWQEHFAWNEDATELIGLSATGRATISALKMNRRQIVRVRKMWVAMGNIRQSLDSHRLLETATIAPRGGTDEGAAFLPYDWLC